MIHRSKEVVKKLPLIKPHLDFIAALLTIPVLVTVIILNFSNLSKNKTTQISPTPTQQTQNGRMVTVIPVKPTHTNPTPTDSPTCKQDIGPISIADPTEGDTITANPVCISIDYAGEGYCSVVWAYRINGGALSDYSNNSVCLYNMTAGTVTFELDVKSLVSNQTRILTRTFQYAPTPTTTPIPSPTQMPTPVPTVHP